MSTASERLSLIQANYNSALNNEPHDLAKAQTAGDVTAIQANLANARAAYFAAIAAELSTNSDGVEAAFEAARAAHTTVEKARKDAASLPALLQTLTSATNAATSLLALAKKIRLERLSRLNFLRGVISCRTTEVVTAPIGLLFAMVDAVMGISACVLTPRG